MEKGVKVKKNKGKKQQTKKEKPDLGLWGKLSCERKGRGVCKKIDLFGCEEDEEEQRGKEMKGGREREESTTKRVV